MGTIHQGNDQMKFHTAYSKRERVFTVPIGPSMTKQSESDACDINQIMAKFQVTGLIDHGNRYEGSYEDATSITYHEAMNLVIAAQEMFDDLPSATRARFSNDPAAFLDFVQDEKNKPEMIKLGLANAAAVEPNPPHEKSAPFQPSSTNNQDPTDP